MPKTCYYRYDMPDQITPEELMGWNEKNAARDPRTPENSSPNTSGVTPEVRAYFYDHYAGLNKADGSLNEKFLCRIDQEPGGPMNGAIRRRFYSYNGRDIKTLRPTDTVFPEVTALYILAKPGDAYSLPSQDIQIHQRNPGHGDWYGGVGNSREVFLWMSGKFNRFSLTLLGEGQGGEKYSEDSPPGVYDDLRFDTDADGRVTEILFSHNIHTKGYADHADGTVTIGRRTLNALSETPVVLEGIGKDDSDTSEKRVTYELSKIGNQCIIVRRTKGFPTTTKTVMPLEIDFEKLRDDLFPEKERVPEKEVKRLQDAIKSGALPEFSIPVEQSILLAHPAMPRRKFPRDRSDGTMIDLDEHWRDTDISYRMGISMVHEDV